MGLFSTIREPAFCLVNMLTGFITLLQSEKHQENNIETFCFINNTYRVRKAYLQLSSMLSFDILEET
jgi:hypothetical protein